MPIDAEFVKRHTRDIPDWPDPGVVCRDATPLVGDATVVPSGVGALLERA